MKLILSVLVLGLSLQSTQATLGKVSKELLGRIAYRHLMDACWGKENMKAWFKELEETIEKCQQQPPNPQLIDDVVPVYTVGRAKILVIMAHESIKGLCEYVVGHEAF